MTIDSPFAGATPVPDPRAASTLVQGRTFCLSSATGDIVADRPHGLFVLDTRVLSRLDAYVAGQRLEGLAIESHTPFEARFVTRAHPAPGHADADLVVLRTRSIGRGMRERIEITNYGLEPVDTTFALECDVDFAHLFEVKQGRVERRGHRRRRVDHGQVVFTLHHDGHDDEVIVRFDASGDLDGDLLNWPLRLAPGGTFHLCFEVALTRNGRTFTPRFRCDGDDGDGEPFPVVAHERWHADLPDVETDEADLALAVSTSGADIGSLRIHDSEHPDWAVLAAGAPWYMTVFGRDSLLTAWMTMIADPDLARGVLRTLARLQGRKVDADTEEQPGKILHELRATSSDQLSIEHASVYFGSIDATPLFVMLLGELARWCPDDGLIAELLDHADAALAWIDESGDLDGDGFVEYRRMSPDGLANQGWKDSWDAVRHADGRLATTPIAMCEVQAYVYGAYVARAELAELTGDEETRARYVQRAAALRDRFDEQFWDDELGCHVLALDGDKRPVRVASSNPGHALWTGIALPERAARVADTLLSEAMFSGWGIRTLSTDAAAFNPISYHNGSVWPHDNALAIAGLTRYGFVDHAHRVIRAQMDVARYSGGRLPELMAGFSRSDIRVPSAYPASCSPQAWAAAAPFVWLRALLGFEPTRGGSELAIAPSLLEGMGLLRVSHIDVGGQRVSVTVANGAVRVDGADALQVRLGRPPPMAVERLVDDVQAD